MQLEWNPRTRSKLGLVMVAVSGTVTAGWSWTSFKSADLAGSPYLWAVVLMVYFTGITLIGASWPVPDKKINSQRLRRRLVLHFMASLAAMGLLFLLIHIAIGGHPPQVGQKYAPWTLLGGLLSYVPFYYYRSHPANLKGMGTLLVPLLYMVGQCFAPIAVIDYYNSITQRVETINSIRDLSSARSSFLAFRNLEVVPDHALEQEYHFVESDGRHHVSYQGLLPVNTGRSDTLYTTWLLFSEDNYFSPSVSQDTERAFYSRNRDHMLHFTRDSAVFYDHSKLDSRSVLRKHNYPLTAEAIVLIPVSTSLDKYVGSQYKDNLFITCLLILFFWVGAAVDRYRND